MPVNISDEEMKMFNDNGISVDQVRNTVNLYRNDGLSDDEIRAKVDVKLQGFQTQSKPDNIIQNQEQEITTPQDDVVTGSVTQNVRTYLDKKGRVHYENEDDGSKMNWFKRQGRNIKAKLSNLGDFLQEDNPNSEAYGQKAGILSGIISMPFGAAPRVTQWGASKLLPFFGKKMAQTIAEYTGGGLVGGAVDGAVTGATKGIIEDKNPLVTGVQGALTNGIIGAVSGAALGGAIGKGVKAYRGNKLRNSNTQNLTKEEIKNLRENAKSYYDDYINGTTVKREDLGEIKFTNKGIDEQTSKGLHNVTVIPDLKKQIKQGKKQEYPRKDYEREDIKQFHIIDNNINGKDMEYQIAEDVNGNKYYFAKDVTQTKNEGLPPTNWNQNPASEINPSNIITDNAENINPNVTVGDNIPEGLKAKGLNYRQQLEEALGLTKDNWDQQPNFYSKEKENEAFAILSQATGKSVKWLKSQLNSSKNGKGSAKRREFIELLVENTGDKLDGYPNGKFYFTNNLSYAAKDADQVGAGQDLAEQVFDDITSRNFDLDYREPLERDIATADIEYKKIMRRLLDSKGADESFNEAMDDFDEAIRGLPEEVQAEYVRQFINDMGNIGNMFKTERMRASGDLKQSQLAQNADLPEELSKGVQQYPPEYEVLHNKDLIANARAAIEKDPSSRLARLDDLVSNDKPVSAQDMEESRQLLTLLYQEGRIDEALALTKKMTVAGSRAGQAVQAMSLWAKTTPEGAIRQAQKIIDEYNEKARKKIPDLSVEQAQNIIDMTEKIQATPDGREKDIATGELLKTFQSLVPQSGGNKLKTLRNISLLLNGKTFTRNVIGNTIFSGMENLVTKPLAAGIDNFISLFKGQRTRTLPQMKEYGQGLVQGLKEGAEDVKLGIDTRNLGGRFDLPQGRSFENTPVMGALEKALDFSLRVPDRAFYQATFNESLANQMKAAGLSDPTKEMIEQATQEALESVYQNNGKISSMVSAIRKGLNKVGVKDFGLGDALIPYAQTPANVAQQGINYSPLGIVNVIKNGIIEGNRRQATLDAARAIIGSGLIGAGSLGAKGGLFTDNVEDYKTKKNYEALGIRPNQIILPNGSVMSYSQLQPLAAPLATGDILNSIQGGNYMQALDKGLGTLADLSMLRGITNFTKDYNEDGIASAIANTITGLPSQLIGTGINQINTYVDPYQRETYSPNPLMQGINQARAKTPFISKTLPKKYDVTGQEIKKYDGDSGLSKMVNNFINPVFVSKPKDDIVMNEVMTLYEVTGEKGSLLNVPEKKIKLDDGTSKQLSGKEYSEYSKRLGEVTYDGYKQIMNTQRYLNADDSTRLKLLEDIKKNAKGIVQEELFGKVNKYSAKNAIGRKLENKLNRGQNKINRVFNKIDNQLVDDIMYKE